MSNVIPFDVQFAQLVSQIEHLIKINPLRAYRAARNLKRRAIAIPRGNDPIANTQRFLWIDKASHLVIDAKLAIVAAGSMVPSDRDPDDDSVSGTVVPFTPRKP
jgi:hypothetical protein